MKYLRNRTKTIFVVISVMASVWLVTRFVNAGGTILTEVQKVTAIMKLIQTSYVEQVDLEILTEGAIEGMLKRLDPHSVYMPPKEQEEFAERDRGEFEGIGISFVIQNELITVISPITGTPAERVGLRAGDRIIEIDDVSAYGISNEEVFKKLRGQRGTSVKIKVLREGLTEAIDFTIVRDRIPIYSVWSQFMLDDSTGYILLNQFTSTTTTELQEALNSLENQGMKRLIFDLRNNQGGRLNEAVSVADMFIPGGHPIVSKRGRIPNEDTTYYSTDFATHPLFDLTILINNGSASASEIVAGAVQDLDRGLVIGKTSFGKGLVQYPYNLRDGGVIRLSVAHYYTPSGRLIQRSYEQGRSEYYASRGKKNENDKDLEEFKTLGGRTVLSGSGITPDIEVNDGTLTVATARLIGGNVLFNHAENLIKKYNLKKTDDFRGFLQDFHLAGEDFSALQELAKTRELSLPDEALESDREYIETQVIADIVQLLWNDRNYYYQARIYSDPVVKQALESFPRAREISMLWRKSSKG